MRKSNKQGNFLLILDLYNYHIKQVMRNILLDVLYAY